MARRAGTSLRRDLGILGNFAFAYSDVSEGLFFTLGLVLVYANGAAVYAYLFATIAYLLTAVTYAELSSSYHQAGGAFTFANRAFGSRVAFLAAWALLLDYLVTTAISAVAAVGYMGYFLPISSLTATGIAVAIVAGLLLLNILGVAGSARFSYMLVLFDLAGVVVVIAFGFLFSYHPGTNPPPVFGTAPTYTNFLYAVTIAMSSYLGIEVVSQSAGETRNAGVNIPRAVFLISVAVVAATLSFSTLALGTVPYQAFQDNPTAVSFPVSYIASTLPQGWVLGGLTALLGISVLLVASNAGIIGISRLSYSMSEGGVVPKVLGRVHSKYRTPYVSIIIFSLISIGIIVVFTAKLDVLAEMYNFGALLAYMIVGVSLISLRNKEKSLVRPFRVPGSIRFRRRAKGSAESVTYEVPIIAVGCFVADFIIWLLVVALHPVGREVGTMWLGLGILVYYLYSRVSKRNDRGRATIPIPETIPTP